MTIGLFIQIEDPKMWLVLNGANDAARLHGVDLIVYGSPTEAGYKRLDDYLLPRTTCFRKEEHSGILVAFASEPLLSYANKLHKAKHPVMLLATRTGTVPSTCNDCSGVMREAVALFATRGHQRIAFLAGPADNLHAAEKLEGYQQGLDQQQIPYDHTLLIQGDYTENGGYLATQKWLARGGDCSAFIASNDLGALGAMRAFREKQIFPGADVEILGYDNIPRARWSKPALSSYDPHLYQMGYEACVELLRTVRKEESRPQLMIPATLVPRHSTWEETNHDELKHPLVNDWIENRFFYDAQLAVLSKDAHSAELIGRLPSLGDSPETFLQTFRELLDEVSSRNLSAGCLTPLLELCGRDENPRMQEVHKEACALQNNLLFEEQRRRTETAMRYSSCTLQLRELSQMAAKEDTILKTFGQAVRALGIPQAGVFLYHTPMKIAEAARPGGDWYWWAQSEATEYPTGRKFWAPAFSPALLPDGREPCGWLYLPLIYNQELFGTVILDTSSEFLVHYPDMVRQLSVALRAGRLQDALTQANSELVETSRLAGLAEMATGILHNIGNALNSVNTSCGVLVAKVRKSKMPNLAKATALMKEHHEDIARFLADDPKGKQLPGYLQQLAEHLGSEQESFLKELAELQSMIDHINQIVAAQQSVAQISGVQEKVAANELLEFALKLGEASLNRHGIAIKREYAEVPHVRAQRQKAIQILVNLIRNAKESVDEAKPAQKQIRLCIRSGKPGFIQLVVADNGIGISQENISRIFGFGFTTKQNGHGFGLHNSALAAKEMGGLLSAESEGKGKGASFILELPCEAALSARRE